MSRRTVVSLLSQAEVVETEDVTSVARDPADDKFLAAAGAASAEYLVTEDQDLLVLQEYRGTRIVGAATFAALHEAM